MKAILLILWLLLCINVFAQHAEKKYNNTGTIAGRIIADNSGSPVEGASVTLRKTNDSAYSRLDNTDKNGAFKLTNLQAGSYYIIIKHLGYNEYISAKLVVDEINHLLILPAVKLKTQNYHLKEVVIAAAPKPYTEQKIDRTIVNVGELLSNIGVSAVEILNNAPGVEVTDNAISLRGKQGVTIYIDGRQTYLDGPELVNYLKSLPSGTIDKIELMSNPPAKYHVNGSAGLINIITKKNKADGFNGNLSASHAQGYYAKSSYSLNLNYKTGKFSFFGSSAYSLNNNYFKVARDRDFRFADQTDNYSIDQANFETSNRKSTHYKFGLDADLNTTNSIGFVVDGVVSPYREKGDYLLQFSHATPDSVIKTLSYLNRHTNDVAVNVYYQHKFKNEGELIRIDADYLNYSDNAVQTLVSNTYLPNGSTLLNNYNLLTENPFKANVYSIKADYETKISANIKLATGLQSIYSNRGSNGNYFNSPNVPNDSLTSRNTYTENINAAYLSLTKELKRFTLQAGLRFENSRSNSRQFNYAGVSYLPIHLINNDLFPKVYASYKLDTAARNTLIFSFNTRIDRPDYSSLNPFAFYFDKYTVFQGNAALQPERITNFDLSLNHSGGFTFGALFNTGSNTIIQYYNVSGLSLINTSLNISNYYQFGFYSNSSVPVFKWWMVNLYGQLAQQIYEGPIPGGEYLNNRVLTFQISGNNQLKLNNGFSAEFGGSYRTKTTYGQGYYLPVWRINTGLQKKVLNGKGAVTLAGTDLFHSWNIRRDIFVNNAQIISTNGNDTRQVNLTFTYRFGSIGKASANKSGLQTERSRAGVN